MTDTELWKSGARKVADMQEAQEGRKLNPTAGATEAKVIHIDSLKEKRKIDLINQIIKTTPSF